MIYGTARLKSPSDGTAKVKCRDFRIHSQVRYSLRYHGLLILNKTWFVFWVIIVNSLINNDMHSQLFDLL